MKNIKEYNLEELKEIDDNYREIEVQIYERKTKIKQKNRLVCYDSSISWCTFPRDFIVLII